MHLGRIALSWLRRKKAEVKNPRKKAVKKAATSRKKAGGTK